MWKFYTSIDNAFENSGHWGEYKTMIKYEIDLVLLIQRFFSSYIYNCDMS